jgi:hypothetical protein
VTRTLCGLMLLFAIGCSNSSPTAPTPAPPPTQSGPTVINLQWNVAAASCAPVTMPPAQPPFAEATIVRQSDTSVTASWPFVSGARTGTLYANFILENAVWGLCSWDIADV